MKGGNGEKTKERYILREARPSRLSLAVPLAILLGYYPYSYIYTHRSTVFILNTYERH